MAILSKVIYRFSSIPIKIPKQGKNNSQIHLERQKTQNRVNKSYNKRTAGGITIPDLKLYYRAIMIKKPKKNKNQTTTTKTTTTTTTAPAWFWYRDRQVDQ